MAKWWVGRFDENWPHLMWDPAHADAAKRYMDFSLSCFIGFNILMVPCIVSPEVRFHTTTSQFKQCSISAE